jgi:alpha-N-arabinofuranosidase
MYKPFKDSTHLPLEITAPTYEYGEYNVPSVDAAAARGKDGTIYVARANLRPNDAATVSIALSGVKPRSVSGQIITASAINSINTFDQPETVKPRAFTGARVSNERLNIDLPAKSVVFLRLQ